MLSKFWCHVTGELKGNISSSSGNNAKTYEIGDHLLDAFREDISRKKGKEQYGMNYKNYVDFIWTVMNPSKTLMSICGLGNPILMEDVYHKPTFRQVGKGGDKASSLRIRFETLKAYFAFLRRRRTYGGKAKAQMISLLDYVEIWTSQFTDMIARRKTDIRRIKKKRLMTPSHFIKSGRSNHVKVLVKQLDDKNVANPTIRLCQNVQNYLICSVCIMNALRVSNIKEQRVEDVNKAEGSNDCPGYFTFTNSRNKISTIYEDKSLFFRKIYLDIGDLYEEITTYSKSVIQ